MGKRKSPKKKSSTTKAKPKKPKPLSSPSSQSRDSAPPTNPSSSQSRESRDSAPPSNPGPPCSIVGQVETHDSVMTSPSTPSPTNAQSIVSKIVLAIDPVHSIASQATEPSIDAIVPVKVVPTTEPAATAAKSLPPVTVSASSKAAVNASKLASQDPVISSTQPGSDNWVNMVKGSSRQLKKKGEAFTLDSGEVCVKIPNSVIERNRKAWDCFVLGQFYSDPPSQGTIHNIVNGIWSKQYRDVAVSKMEGNSFLFRIPNAFTRNRVLNQRLWQIEGQTMFVAKWEPGLVPMKPELTSAPIWLELRNVPLQFFHEEGLERIAGLVGDPKFLHPSTASRTNLEVAKVFTLIDPRKPLPEAVNVQFDSGEIRRILVSSPFMPPVCAHCKQIGHSLRHCKLAPSICTECSSSSHTTEQCHRLKTPGPKKKRPQHRRRSKTPVLVTESIRESVKGKEKAGRVWAVKDVPVVVSTSVGVVSRPADSLAVQSEGILLGTGKKLQGEPSHNSLLSKVIAAEVSSNSHDSGDLSESDCAVESDSSDILSSDTEEEKFTKVLTKRQRRDLRGMRLKSQD